MSDAVINVENLRKTYRTAFRRRPVEVLQGISFSVKPGEIFGFLGPNGAGKTTTIRILTGLITASSGTASVFGHRIPSRVARARLGFLPETPYFYEYLSVYELLDLTGRLFGLSRSERRTRAAELIERVGLGHAAGKRLKGYSKGMLQRAGIAQALMNDPELVILDEPMGGLDPLGRKDVRDIIYSLRDAGKTVFFSSHILGDVEAIADRVAILVRGTIRDVGTVSQLVNSAIQGTDVMLAIPSDLADDAVSRLAGAADSHRRRDTELLASLSASADVDQFLADARELGANVISVTPQHQTLEDVFIRRANAPGKDDSAEDRATGSAP